MFLLDKNKFVNDFIPPKLRKPRQRAWINVIVWHVFDLWNELFVTYNSTAADLSTNIGTDVFQARLRSLYPNVGSYKCFVKNQYDSIPACYTGFLGEHHAPEYDYFLNESPVQYEEFLDEQVKPYDYHIIIPTTYSANASAITFLCNRFRPAGKRYQIIFQNITS